MNKPPTEELLMHIPSKYALVTIAAKRARQITEGNEEDLADHSIKPVVIALKEIAAGNLKAVDNHGGGIK